MESAPQRGMQLRLLTDAPLTLLRGGVPLLDCLAHLAELQILHQQHGENRQKHQHRNQTQPIPTVHILLHRIALSRLMEARYVALHDTSIL